MKQILSTLCILCMAVSLQAQDNLIVGTYTSNNKSGGIYVYRFDQKTGKLTLLSQTEGVKDPSFLTVSNDGKNIYAVNEIGEGEVSSFAFYKGTGQVKAINKQPSGGAHPCYIALHPNGKWVAAGNYSGGNFSILPVLADGSLGNATALVQHKGKGPRADRQDKPHVHSTVFSKDGQHIFVSDLGLDKVMVYAFNNQTGTVTLVDSAVTKPGTGPRHFEIHPKGKFAYLVEEITGTVAVFRYDGKTKLVQVQQISSYPKEYKGAIGSADIHISPDGRFVYVSNRFEANNIAIFAVDQKTGKLSLVGEQSVLGKKPRNFNFDPSGNFLLVANQESNDIVVFKRDISTGLLSPTGEKISVPAPVCLKWISSK